MSPMIDMLVPLSNPYTLDFFDVHRRKQIVNGYGEAAMSVEIIPDVSGIVYPEGLADLSRRPEAQTNSKSIVAITRFALRSVSTSSEDGAVYQPDIIVWRDDSFLVVRVEDYSNFADGFVKVTAAGIDMSDQAPETKN